MMSEGYQNLQCSSVVAATSFRLGESVALSILLSYTVRLWSTSCISISRVQQLNPAGHISKSSEKYN